MSGLSQSDGLVLSRLTVHLELATLEVDIALPKPATVGIVLIAVSPLERDIDGLLASHVDPFIGVLVSRRLVLSSTNYDQRLLSGIHGDL